MFQEAAAAAASGGVSKKKVEVSNPMKRALEEVATLKATGALDESQIRGKLVVSVVRAMGLIKADRLGKSDPFVAVRVEGHQRNTPVIKNDQDPVWNLSFSFKVYDRTRTIVECFLNDMDGKTKGDPLGQASSKVCSVAAPSAACCSVAACSTACTCCSSAACCSVLRL